ncbi:MAG: carbonic anhydrase [Gammaproteobacteria bacterium]|nr:MAG: carbonic anhydrase [Gammaproteobacteria bacterium]TDJ38416.1 MAG: carbonic anhydrase [Gammaproteobacteria bacterium]
MRSHTAQFRSLAWATILTAMGAVGPVNAEVRSSVMTRETQAATTPAKALQMLKQGNARFVAGEATDYNYLAQVKQTASGQFPFASVLSCLDSRIPPEIVFNRGIGDLFVARVAGNFVNDDILGSLEFAAKIAGSKLIVVMGHSECGAVKGACDAAQLGLLSTTLASINPAVSAVQGHTPRSSANGAFVQAVAEMNVTLTMKKLRDRSVVLRQMIDAGEIALVGAMYDVGTGRVRFFE